MTTKPMCFSTRARLTALLAILLLTAMGAFAKDGRDFAGRYSIHDVTQQGDKVQFTMHLKVMNNSDADVKNAVVALRQNRGTEPAGQTKPIKLLKDRGSATLSQQFTVSKQEYEIWGRGAGPTMFVVYQAKGSQWSRYIQLAPE